MERDGPVRQRILTPMLFPAPLSNVVGSLQAVPAAQHLELLAEPVARSIASVPGALVAAIDPTHADTDELCAAYGISPQSCANAVIVRGTRAGVDRHVCCLTLAHRRVDVNNVVRRKLDARKASFAPMDFTVEVTGMEYGGITPIGLPADWPLWVDAAVAAADWVCIGSGVRGSKLFVLTSSLVALPGAEVVDGLARDQV